MSLVCFHVAPCVVCFSVGSVFAQPGPGPPSLRGGCLHLEPHLRPPRLLSWWWKQPPLRSSTWRKPRRRGGPHVSAAPSRAGTDSARPPSEAQTWGSLQLLMLWLFKWDFWEQIEIPDPPTDWLIKNQCVVQTHTHLMQPNMYKALH